MSEVENQGTSILLPASTVAVYSKDRDTLQAARDLVNDWRFARVNVQDLEGQVDEAIKVYKEIPSPDLVIVQTDTIDDSFIAGLEELAGQCEEGTSAIIIGPDNDVNLYRKLIDMGVSDYLVRPVSAADLSVVISKALVDKIGVTGSRLFAVVGAKGGVGASVIAQAYAAGTSELLGQKTMLLDIAGGWSTLSVGLGFEPTTTLNEAIRAAENNDEDSLKRMLHQPTEKLSVLATGGDPMLEANIKPEQIEKLIDMLMLKYPVVFADLSQSSENLQRAVLSRANLTLIVSTPTLPSLRLARTLIQEISDLRGGEHDTVRLLINMQGIAAGQEVTKNDIQKAMGFDVSAFIEYDPKTFIANEAESKLLTKDPTANGIIRSTLLPIIKNMLAVSAANDALEDEKSESGFLDGLLGKLKKKA